MELTAGTAVKVNAGVGRARVGVLTAAAMEADAEAVEVRTEARWMGMDALGAGTEETETGTGVLVACIETLADEESMIAGTAGAMTVAGLTRCSTSPICWLTSQLVPPGVWKKSRRVFLVGLASDVLLGESRDHFFPPRGVSSVGRSYDITSDLPDTSPAVATPSTVTGAAASDEETARSPCGAMGLVDMSSPVGSTWRRA